MILSAMVDDAGTPILGRDELDDDDVPPANLSAHFSVKHAPNI